MRKLLVFPLLVSVVLMTACSKSHAPPITTISPPNTASKVSTTPPTTLTPQWNMAEVDAVKNGNWFWAQLKAIEPNNLRLNAISPAPIDVFKRPWEFYGKAVKLTGNVRLVEDFPPGNPVSQALGGTASAILLITNDSTIVYAELVGTSGNIIQGSQVSVYGFVAGTLEASNNLTSLLIVCYAFDLVR